MPITLTPEQETAFIDFVKEGDLNRQETLDYWKGELNQLSPGQTYSINDIGENFDVDVVITYDEWQELKAAYPILQD